MLTEMYIEAVLADEELADHVWDLWDAGEITDHLAALAWWLVSERRLYARKQPATWMYARRLVMTQSRRSSNDA